jgi:hypothetical protein
MNTFSRLAACLGALLLAATATANESAASGLTAAPAVVELFTSEGCSSCPPAEAVLGSLASRPDVLALAFHVTYWDNPDWRDVFGQAEADKRQAHYARSLRLASAYTPQVVVNGSVDVVGSNQPGIELAIARLPRPARVPGQRTATGWSVRLPALSAACPCRVRWIGVRSVAQVQVHGGENAGRALKEYRIVRSVQPAEPWDGSALEQQVSLAAMPADATSIVVLAERAHDGSIVAVGEWPL